MEENKKFRKNVKIVVKREYTGSFDMQQVFTEVLKQALLKKIA